MHDKTTHVVENFDNGEQFPPTVLLSKCRHSSLSLKLLGNKGPKNVSSTFRNRLKFGRVSRKDLLCIKMSKKNGLREFFQRGQRMPIKFVCGGVFGPLLDKNSVALDQKRFNFSLIVEQRINSEV